MKFQYYFTDTLFSRILFTLLFLGALSIYSYGQINMSNTTVSTCLDVIYDDGGPGGNYTENNYQMTVCASSGTELYFVLQMLDLGTAFNGDSDILTIYEGTGTGGLVLFDSEVDPAPTGIIMSNDPCITITIDTDPHFFSTPTAGGFELLVSCTVPETCSDGILNNGEVQIDCGGPNCAPCYQPTSCGGVIVQNGDFETVDAFGCANNTDSEIHSNSTSVEHWYGTTEEAGPQGGITPDYWTIAGCGVNPNISGSVGPCASGQGALGFFPAREEVQSQLAQPLIAGQEYCLTVDVASNSANAATADLFFWFHNQVFSSGTGIYDLVADNGGVINIVTGPIGATPQIVNDPTNVFTNVCQQFTSSFCATGGESYIVAGGSYATGITYLIIDNLIVTEACPLDFNSSIITIGSPDCAGSCIDLVAQTSNQTGGCEVTNDFEFQWYENGVLMPGQTNDTLLSVCPNGAVTYSVEITYSAGCTSYTKPAVETSVSFCGAFSIVVDAAPSSICLGECTDLSVLPSPAGTYTYTWTEQGNPTVIGTSDIINVCPTTTTTYEVEVFDGANTIIGLVEVVVNPLATINVSPDVSICDGGSTDLTASGGVSYTWDNGIGSGAGPHSVNPNVTTIYNVIGLDANGCEGTAQVTVTVDGTGPALVLTGSDITCFGFTDGSAEVVATGTAPFSYNWIPNGGTNAIATGLGAGSYSVEVTDGNGCVSNESILINEPTDLSLTISSTASDCSVDNGSASVVASGGSGAYTYSWTPGGATTPSITSIGAGIYSVQVTDANGCVQNESVNVETVSGPNITIDLVNDVSCSGQSDGSATISVNGGTPGYSYSWSPIGGSAPTVSGLSPGNYTVTVTDASGCVTFEQVTIGEPVPLSLSGMVTDSDCGLNNGSIDLMVSGGTGTYTYTWLPSVSMTPSANNLEVGDYTVTITDANNCSVNATYSVGVINGLDVTITPDNFTVNQGDNLDLVVTVVPSLPNLTYTWVPSDGLSCSNCPNPTASPNETTTYTVIVTSDDGCEGEASVTITVVAPCLGAYLPTVFSPNEDGTNDALCLLSNCIETMDLSIYNRWGERVFHSTHLNNCWDGRYKGELVNTGVFVYKLRAMLTNGDEIEDSGNVTVVR